MKRDYGIDLVKMLAMMMVVAHHILMYGNFEAKLGGWGNCVVGVFHCFCYCAVDVFVMATGWIMCRHNFKYVRLFYLWRRFVGYSLFLVCMGACVLPSGVVCWRDWLESVTPILSNVNWFLTEYVALFFTIPFLNKMLGALAYRDKLVLEVSGIGLLSILPLVSGHDLFITKWGYSYVWFLFLYVTGAILVDVMANENSRRMITRMILVVCVIVGCVCSELSVIVCEALVSNYGFGGRLGEMACSYTSPTILLEALGLFLFFSRVEIKSKRLCSVVALLAPSTFIVFVVHTNSMFHKLTGWENCFHWFLECGSIGVITWTIVVSVVVFVAIVLFDTMRRILVQRFQNVRHG